ncbi:FAD-binding protein [Streptomyces sp. NPDC086777]|uniref:FAD-binding protein n=1 Tax=Streptomyces sp. NPDC086777 TaxID=3154866 RepID=UPI00344CC826
MSSSAFDAWGLRTVALAKQVPRDDPAPEFGADGRLTRRAQFTEMNPFCRRAVAHAVSFAQDTGGSSTVVTMGPPGAADVVREAMAWGADRGVHISDASLAGADCLVTARLLATAVRGLGETDLIMVGRNSVDGDTGVVGPMVAELLGLPFVGPALSLGPADTPQQDTGTRRVLQARLQRDGAVEEITVSLPAVIAVAERSCAPAKVPPEQWAPVSRVRRLDVSALGLDRQTATTSPTRVRGVRPASRSRQGQLIDSGHLQHDVAEAVGLLARRGVFVTSDASAEDSAPSVGVAGAGRRTRTLYVALGNDVGPGSRALLGEASAIAARANARVVAIAPPSSGRQELFGWGADALLTATSYDPRPLSAALASAGAASRPWAILAPATAWGREVLARLAVQWGAGLVSDVTSLRVTEPATGLRSHRLVGSKPCGGHYVANVDSVSAVQLLTVRTGCLSLRKPRPEGPLPTAGHLLTGTEAEVVRRELSSVDDYDCLDRAEFVIGVGRGIVPADYGELEELRGLLRAEVAATRAVTDASWLPHSRQVGVTARNISPRLYIAAGMSGSPLHMVGVGRAGTVLAINTDPEAQVFQHSDVGIVGDWRAVFPLLSKEVRRHLDLPVPVSEI